MMPENDLKDNPCTVTVYMNNESFVSKFFEDRKEIIEWMLKVTKNLEGIKNLYFQLAYQYPVLKEHKDYGAGFWAQPIKKEEKERVLRELPTSEYSNKVYVRPKAEYSNPKWH